MQNNKENQKETIAEVSKDTWEVMWKSSTPFCTDNFILNYFVYEAYLDEANVFAKEKNLTFVPEPYLIERDKIRKCIEKGIIDDVITLINDINPEILVTNIVLYYKLLEHKTAEMIYAANQDDLQTYLDEILEYIRCKLVPLIEKCDELNKPFENFLAYLVFNDGDIQEKRKNLVLYTNDYIMKIYNVKNELKSFINSVLEGEEKLKTKYKFPTLQSYYE